VVLVTARGQPRDIEAGLAAGADAYLVKPFNSMKLLEIVKRLCEKFAH
jgi:DNA-binding response OmpR family regulator